jgi:tetratricopeptide (TPR) repeat protein
MLNLSHQRGAMECPVCSSKIQDDSLFCRVCGTRLRPPDDGEAHTQAVLHLDRDLMIGNTFLDRYRIVGELGRGGMGVVYKAEDMKLRRSVALKFLPPDLTRDPTAKERFIHEAQAASALDHPGICTIHEIEETTDGRMFISMGCYEGETLKDRITKGPLEIGEALGIAVQVAEGLEEAHERGIVHRDIKPSNIIVTPKGQAKIMDFGLAKLAGQTRITKAGTTMGTIAYMSPEQARGEDIDHRTDIWSLGVVLHEMLTGEQPFKGEYDQAVIYSILNEDPRSTSEINRKVPAAVDAIVAKSMRKDPAERYQSSSELLADLVELGKRSPHLKYARSRRANLRATEASRGRVLKVSIPLAVAAAAVVLVLVSPGLRGFLGRLAGGGGPTRVTRLAVLPCTIAGGSSTDTAFCYGMAANVTERLTYLEGHDEGLYVIPADKVRFLEEMSAAGAHRELGANVVLTGNLARAGDEVSLRPIRVDFDVEDGGSPETDTFMERRGRLVRDPLANLSTWQDSVLMDLADLLDIGTGPEARTGLTAHSTMVPEAYVLYLEGLGYLYPYDGSRNLEDAITRLERAVDADSSYVLAQTGLAVAYGLKSYYEGETSWSELAVRACDRALEYAPNYADADVVAGDALGYAGATDLAIERYRQAVRKDPLNFNAYVSLGDALRRKGDYEGAEAAYSIAAELRPLRASAQKRLSYIRILRGEFNDAVTTALRTIELEPYDTRGYNDLGTAYSCLHRTDDAREAFERSLDLDSNYIACTNLGTIYFGQSRYADAARMYERALALEPGNYRITGFLSEAYYWSPGWRERGIETFRHAIDLAEGNEGMGEQDETLLSDLASYYARIGEAAKSESLLVMALALQPREWAVLFRIADTFEQLGQRKQALDWVKKAIEEGAPMEAMDHYPGLKDLRTDRRYKDIVAHHS